MTSALAPPFADWPRIPYVGVGCIVERNGEILLVRDHRGLWSTPGGHLDFGESPSACAERETREEAGVVVTNVDFVAVTNDVLDDVGKHYVTIWMRGDAGHSSTCIEDTSEIAEAGWFSPEAMPGNLHKFFLNLIAGRCMPQDPSNLPRIVGLIRRALHVGHD
jgi:8-oxo-dGTP diphosphatase